MTEIPNIVRERLKVAPAGDHPDANLLTAFAERALPDRERIQVLEHLARCTDCRDVLAQATPPLSSAAMPGHKDTGAPARVSWLGWPTLRWGALAACVVIVGAAVLVRHDLMRSQSAAYVKTDAMPEAMPALSSDLDKIVISETPAANEKKQEPETAAKPKSDRKAAFLSKSPAVPSAPVDSVNRDKEWNYYSGVSGALRKKDLATTIAAGAAVGGPLPVPPPPVAPAPDKGELLSPPAANLPLAGRNVASVVNRQAPSQTSQAVEVTGANEVVEVQSAAVQAETSAMQYDKKKQEMPGKAKGAAADSSVVTLPKSATSFNDKLLTAAAETRANRLESELARSRLSMVSRWTISSDGQLQHSLDAGKTWQPVTVADKATFRALSANGPDLWVGGPAGLLYHSVDSGSHWTQIKPSADGSPLAADIATIEFTDRLHGKLTTSTGEIWITADAGETWRKQS